jgi:DNA repair protein RecO (recombination protein O)
VAAQVDLAICLRRLDYSETSQVLVIFTRRLGVLHVIAKGARRTTKAGDSRFSGGIDLLDLGEAVVLHQPEKELNTLTEWTLLNGHLGLRDCLRSSYLAQYAAELVTLLLQPNDPHPLSFDDLADLVASLAGAPARSGPEELMLAYQLRLLDAAGFLPQLSACGHCGTPGERGSGYFSPSRSSVICRNCFPAYPDAVNLHPGLARLAATMAMVCRVKPGDAAPPLLSELRLPPLSRQQTDPLNGVLLAHVAFVIGRFPRVAEYLFARTATAMQPRLTWEPHGEPHGEPPLQPLPPRPLDPEEIAAAAEIERKAAEKAAKPRKRKKTSDAVADASADVSADASAAEPSAPEGETTASPDT